MPDLAIIVPTRGRPENIQKVIAAWDFTNAWADADLFLVADADDPEIGGYRALVGVENLLSNVSLVEVPKWLPMVHKLNVAARDLAGRPCTCRAEIEGGGHSHGCRFMAPSYFAMGFAGDDHLPQTIGWAARYLAVLRELGTGMVYGDDGYQGRKLSTEWAVTADVVRDLGRMVPADVEHMYCDNSMMDLFAAAGALKHLPEVRIEHMHPVAGKAETDEQYQRVNHRDQFRKDRTAYESWRRSGLDADVAAVRALRQGRPDVEPEPVVSTRPHRAGSAPRRVTPRSRGTTVTRLPIPRFFKRVKGATPDEIGLALADMAIKVPADQAIVELGVFQGRTALLMAWGARQGEGAHVYGFDAWDLPGNSYGPPFTDAGSETWARYHVQSLGYTSRITLIKSFSTEAAGHWDQPWLSGGKKIGLLFVDDDHSREGARRAIQEWAPHLAPGAVIAVDDYGHPDWPGVAEAVDELVSDGFLAPIQIFHDRLAVTRLTGRLIPVDRVRTPAAITSEGVSPSPYPAVSGQVALDDGRTMDLPGPLTVTVDTEPSTVVEHPLSAVQNDRERVGAGELADVTYGTPITDLNLVNLKALAKARSIVLGARKDKRDLILQALRDGK